MKEEFSGSLVFGLMSGTSCDGLDIAACRFKTDTSGKDRHEILGGFTYSFPEKLRIQLKEAANLSGRDLCVLDRHFAMFMAECVKYFINETGLKPDLLASHGHTVFHQPQLGYTLQIGSGATLAVLSGIDTICDFRQGDVSMGGQGAPLVPMGDKQLFSDWDYCLNLGGFGNVTLNYHESLVAFDICAVNLVLNMLAQQSGKAYDEGGRMAAEGQVRIDFLDRLNALPFYSLISPKSLGTEWLHSELFPVIRLFERIYPVADILRTYTEHIAEQIGRVCCHTDRRVLVSGGGVWNTFLIQRMRYHCASEIIIPDAQIVNFKEALIFAYLGWLRAYVNENIYASVTGAKTNSIAGGFYKGSVQS
ncbi:MAG: anhydro-N-acetylmuramic acid kinase [Bacteroidia bacterium]|jgi:anhydro-N-acetylmuramic acid kinase|nr:anhydro-N-acetylmuramic acid kinase [Bacteroidia bacterium]